MNTASKTNLQILALQDESIDELLIRLKPLCFDKQTSLTAADIRRGSWSAQLDCVINEVANSKTNLQVLELQDESIDELLIRLKPLCLGVVGKVG